MFKVPLDAAMWIGSADSSTVWSETEPPANCGDLSGSTELGRNLRGNPNPFVSFSFWCPHGVCRTGWKSHSDASRSEMIQYDLRLRIYDLARELWKKPTCSLGFLQMSYDIPCEKRPSSLSRPTKQCMFQCVTRIKHEWRFYIVLCILEVAPCIVLGIACTE